MSSQTQPPHPPHLHLPLTPAACQVWSVVVWPDPEWPVPSRDLNLGLDNSMARRGQMKEKNKARGGDRGEGHLHMNC